MPSGKGEGEEVRTNQGPDTGKEFNSEREPIRSTSSCSTPAIAPRDPDGLPPTHPLPPTAAADYPFPRTERIQHHQCTITGD
ncbi:hypothetical protein AVEN_28224-1 [Araneus ventricosus]|uniref:Uncharacterized protein n=1 Tax=Araneus ventricosus TaxID=182803 RepID=A0A4Y2MMF0_ARAVE|nr:hypothetical protein AVEN_203290-1 [Araneus ventricosus]GBN27702.1 hypothetical protein AVEN_28224-1 [Araneus ventricosus]